MQHIVAWPELVCWVTEAAKLDWKMGNISAPARGKGCENGRVWEMGQHKLWCRLCASQSNKGYRNVLGNKIIITINNSTLLYLFESVKFILFSWLKRCTLILNIYWYFITHHGVLRLKRFFFLYKIMSNFLSFPWCKLLCLILCLLHHIDKMRTRCNINYQIATSRNLNLS